MARFNSSLISNTITGTTSVGSPYNGSFTALTGTAPYTVTLANPTLFPGINQQFYNSTSGTVTLSTPAGNFTGAGGTAASTLPVYAGNVVSVTADGTNYIVISEDGSALTATSATISGVLTVQSSGGVAIAPSTTGTIDNVNVGATTRGSGSFNTLTANNAVTFTANTASSTTGTGTVVITGGLGVSGTINATSVSASLTGTIQTAAQANITSVGTLSSLTVSGNILSQAATTASAGSIQVTASDASLRLKWTSSPVADKNTWEVRSVGTGATPYLQFRTINDANTVFTDRVAFTNDGNVGIATTNPQAKLTVKGQTHTAPWFAAERSGSATLQFKIVGAEDTGYTASTGTVSPQWTNVIDSNNSNIMLSTLLGGGTGGKIILDGNVGIGTINPRTLLQVAVPSQNYVSFGNTSFGAGDWYGIHVGYCEGGNVAYRKHMLAYESLNDGAARGNLHLLVNTTFGSASATIADSKLMISGTTGNVGIGTTSPSTKLHVAGALTVNGSASFYSLGSFNTGTSQWVLLGRFTGGTTGETLNLHFYGANGYNGSYGQHSRTFIQIRNGNGNPVDTNVSVDYHTEGQSTMVLDVRVQNVNGIAYGTTWDVYVQINSVCGNAYYIPFINSAASWSHTGTAGVSAPTVGPTVISGTNLFMMNSTSYFLNSVGIGTTTPTEKLQISGVSSGSGAHGPRINILYTGTSGGAESLVNFLDFRGVTNAAIGNNLQDDGVGTASAHLVFKTAISGTLSQRMRIFGNGIVRVGTGTDTSTINEPGIVNVGAISNRDGRYVVGWWVGYTGSATSYIHVKTSLWGGGGGRGNDMYIMGGFHIMGYYYTNPGQCDQWITFHNWSGSTQNAYNRTNAGNWTPDNAAYVGADGYVYIRLVSATYMAYHIDLHQFPIYQVRDITVLSVTNSNSATI